MKSSIREDLEVRISILESLKCIVRATEPNSISLSIVRYVQQSCSDVQSVEPKS